MEQNVEDGNCISPPGTRTSDGQQDISGKADSVESNMSQGTIAPISKAEADGKDITLRAKQYYDNALLQLQLFCSSQAGRHLEDTKHYEKRCQQLETASTGLVLGGVIVGIWTLLADQFSKTNGVQASGNVEQTSGNIRQTSANGEQTSANGKQTSGNITNTSGIGKQTSAIGMKILAGIKRKPVGATVSVAGVFLSGVLQYFSQGTTTLSPSFQRRAEGHRQVLFGWSGLTQKVKATRIELRKADMQSDTLCSKYEEHIKEYQALGQVIVVRDSTREAFSKSETRKAIIKKEMAFLANWPVVN